MKPISIVEIDNSIELDYYAKIKDQEIMVSLFEPVDYVALFHQKQKIFGLRYKGDCRVTQEYDFSWDTFTSIEFFHGYFKSFFKQVINSPNNQSYENEDLVSITRDGYVEEIPLKDFVHQNFRNIYPIENDFYNNEPGSIVASTPYFDLSLIKYANIETRRLILTSKQDLTTSLINLFTYTTHFRLGKDFSIENLETSISQILRKAGFTKEHS
jgi:hypothetical protein